MESAETFKIGTVLQYIWTKPDTGTTGTNIQDTVQDKQDIKTINTVSHVNLLHLNLSYMTHNMVGTVLIVGSQKSVNKS